MRCRMAMAVLIFVLIIVSKMATEKLWGLRDVKFVDNGHVNPI